MPVDQRPVNTDAVDRVRANTDPDVQERLDRDLAARLRDLAGEGPEAISRRLSELDRESDIERLLAGNAAAFALAGVLLAATRSRRWLLLPGVVAAFLGQHSIQGWCPPVSVFRRFGVCTRAEIQAERCALKAMRGDFGDLTPGGAEPADRAEQALAALRR